MVVNAPTSNIVSAAELAVALMLAAARHVSPAHAALKNGEWKRSRYTGIELYEKTVGIVGLGRIGVLVAQRLSAFGMKVIAYDPYVQAGRAAQMGVRLVDLDTLLAESDFMSVHLPKTPETLGLIGTDQLARVKPSLVLVNAARGGIVDEAALYAALKEGRVAAAGLDVFAQEPCTDSPLFELENVVATPHLGASTDEAQEKAGLAVARSVRLALSGELRPRRRQRPGRRDRRGRPARDPADGEARPGLHRARRRGRPAGRRRGARRDRRLRRQGAGARGTQGHLRRRRRGAGLLRQRPAARGRARHRRPSRRGSGEPRPPQPDHHPRHPRRRLVGLGQRHPGRDQPEGAAGRGQRLRRRPRADRPPGVLHLRGPPRHGRHRRRHPR